MKLQPNAINDAIARACGLPTERLVRLTVDVLPDHMPVVRAYYMPEGAEQLVEVLGSLEFREDLAHIEVPAPAPAPAPKAL